MTTDDPAGYVAARLESIPPAAASSQRLHDLLRTAAEWDQRASDDGAAYRSLAALAGETLDSRESPLQVDMAIPLAGRHVSELIADDVARATELLLRLTPMPAGLPHLEQYRQEFVARYGLEREVPLLELLDRNIGLGPASAYRAASGRGHVGGPRPAATRTDTLLALACAALRDRTPAIELDEDTLARLETWPPVSDDAPVSLELNVLVGAASADALDRGEFEVVIAPNLGPSPAGRHLARFTDLLGEDARRALERAAREEEARTPGIVWAELTYLPRPLRTANVAVRPAIRAHEIVIGTSAGVDDSGIIPAAELVVGVRGDRFYLRWTATGAEVRICGTHMLNPFHAPEVGRFLTQVGLDAVPILHEFDWGPAAGFPYLPRVHVGRIVLRPAQWRLDPHAWFADASGDAAARFRETLRGWRERWHVPRYVYLSTGDNRLLLDLDNDLHTEQLRAERHQLRGHTVLQEVVPSLDRMWVTGVGGCYAAEFVVSMVRRPESRRADTDARQSASPTPTSGARRGTSPVPTAVRLRPPGSEWLFAKLYCGRDLQDDMIGTRCVRLRRPSCRRAWHTTGSSFGMPTPTPTCASVSEGTPSA